MSLSLIFLLTCLLGLSEQFATASEWRLSDGPLPQSSLSHFFHTSRSLKSIWNSAITITISSIQWTATWLMFSTFPLPVGQLWSLSIPSADDLWTFFPGVCHLCQLWPLSFTDDLWEEATGCPLGQLLMLVWKGNPFYHCCWWSFLIPQINGDSVRQWLKLYSLQWCAPTEITWLHIEIHQLVWLDQRKSEFKYLQISIFIFRTKRQTHRRKDLSAEWMETDLARDFWI